MYGIKAKKKTELMTKGRKDASSDFFSSCLLSHPRCLKITEKVSFNIASEASYVYILTGQKLIKKRWSNLSNFRKPEANGQTVLPER